LDVLSTHSNNHDDPDNLDKKASSTPHNPHSAIEGLDVFGSSGAIPPSNVSRASSRGGSSQRSWIDQSANDTEAAIAELVKGLTPPQREAMMHERGPLLIVAAAGSGKTANTLSKLREAEGSVLYVTLSAYCVFQPIVDAVSG